MGALAEKFIGESANQWDDAHFVSPEEAISQFPATAADEQLHEALRAALVDPAAGPEEEELQALYNNSSFPQRFNRLFLVLYSPGQKRLLVSRHSREGRWTFARVFQRLLAHDRRAQLVAGDFQLQIDFVEVPPAPVNLYEVGMLRRGARHFQIGIDGLIIEGEDSKVRFFLPGDAFVRSVMGMRQLREYLSSQCGEEYLRQATCRRFRSNSYLLTGSGTCRLYRGLPTVGELSKIKLESAVHYAIEHIKLTQEKDGKFLYYYDPGKDSKQDFEHPKRDLKKNPYYNILRHSGGGLTCIYHEKYTGKQDTYQQLVLAIEYLLTTARFYQKDGVEAAYIYSEKKSKLGGAGIGLYFISEYQLVTGDMRYQYFADALAWHLFHQITETGEFIYYNIYLDQEIGVRENSQYFSFYYPGEALCGLGKYLHLLPPEKRSIYFSRIKLALDYLLNVRPLERAEEYTAVPSDSWLMMGIKELWEFEEMRDLAYADFVFSDARKMIDQMYKKTDAPYPDYAGAFYYEYGDYPYADGARLEGLMGAFELAHLMGDRELMRYLWKALRLGAWALLHLVNTHESTYCTKRPDLALGAIRFKYTRQWFRIDTIQHVACFFAKLLPYWDEAESQYGSE